MPNREYDGLARRGLDMLAHCNILPTNDLCLERLSGLVSIVIDGGDNMASSAGDPAHALGLHARSRPPLS